MEVLQSTKNLTSFQISTNGNVYASLKKKLVFLVPILQRSFCLLVKISLKIYTHDGSSNRMKLNKNLRIMDQKSNTFTKLEKQDQESERLEDR